MKHAAETEREIIQAILTCKNGLTVIGLTEWSVEYPSVSLFASKISSFNS